MSNESFTLSKEDWSLHRKGQQDQERHKEKVKEAIKNNLADLISDEGIIMSDGRQIVKIPIRSLEEYRIRYNYSKNRQPGTGKGGSQVGDVIGNGQPGQGQDQSGAGDGKGVDYEEASVTLEDIEEMLFAELELPNLVPKSNENIQVTDVDFRDVRKNGLMSNIDKRRTLLEAIRHSARNGSDKMMIRPDDLRFRTWEDTIEPDSNAVILALMDTSGSMGLFEKYAARTFFFWMVRFLRTKYENVHIRYIAHHTEAKEVSEEHFFTKGESGGTICSSAYDLALRIIQQDYPAGSYNIYPVHFSDGDNLTSDNEKCIKRVEEICKLSQMFAYAEVNAYARSSTLMSAYSKMQNPLFRKFVIREKSDVYRALRAFFSAAPEEGNTA
ncbi:sporulation protein YhbH [Alicyclobacillus tolerans]|uniref:Uncharacterized protein n=1 Tax=Alicyclobacillus tolerans TaxID=90970 RepID=A0A1M6P228_9BACL|nr:sporulation protein YhbH [Alicyclobacillus montanus]SHK01954.1 hypothetical protein SAMN05443507_10762 [Alicyclobacillus montanus]